MSRRLCGLVFAALLSFTLASAQPPAAPQGGATARPGGGPGNGGAPGIFGGGGRHVAGGPVQHLADGHPDMQGFWNAGNNGGAVFEVQNHPTGRAPFFGPAKAPL